MSSRTASALPPCPDQLAAIKTRFGFSDRADHNRRMRTWLGQGGGDHHRLDALLGRLLDEMRARRIVIPGVSVVERRLPRRSNQAETDLVTAIDGGPWPRCAQRLDALIDDKVHDRQSRLSWLRGRASRVVIAPGNSPSRGDPWDGHIGASLMHSASRAWRNSPGRACYTALFPANAPARRRVVLLATLRELEATLTDAAIDNVHRSWGGHRARKRLEQRGRLPSREDERMLRIADSAESRSSRPGRAVMSRRRSVSLTSSTSSTQTPRSSACRLPLTGQVLDEIAVNIAPSSSGSCSCRFRFPRPLLRC
jgi:hypothetical protein